MKYLLDTDHISLLEHRRGSQYAALVVRLNLHAADGIGVCVVSFQEQLLGANSLIQTARADLDLLRGYELLAACSTTTAGSRCCRSTPPRSPISTTCDSRKCGLAPAICASPP